jgi:hypothetical protein
LPIALPEPALRLEQDSEWCVARIDGEWEQVRFHDYDRIYDVEGLYERIFYDVLRCESPAVIRRALADQLEAEAEDPDDLRALDLGAGNGIMGEELIAAGADCVVGVDIIPEAAEAAERDRPGVYDAYEVCDMTDLDDGERERLAGYEFNCLTCVAALGFGDIPPGAFSEAFNLVEAGGWAAFNIKEDFLDGGSSSGFADLIQHGIERGLLDVRHRERYRHRDATDGAPIHYVAFVARKVADLGPEAPG